MKRQYSFFPAIFIACACMFSSCVDMDTNQSMVLSGEWRGDFGMYYTYVDRGRTYTFDSYDSYIRFIPDHKYASYGVGTQVDYYEYGPYEYQYYNFTWSINDGVIYLSYDYDHMLDTRISNYHMTNDYFGGTFPLSNTSFRLYKVADYYSWTPYVNTYGYGWRCDWCDDYPFYSPATRSADEQATDSTGHVLSRGRRTILRQ